MTRVYRQAEVSGLTTLRNSLIFNSGYVNHKGICLLRMYLYMHSYMMKIFVLIQLPKQNYHI